MISQTADLLIAPCGLNCGVCSAYLRARNRCPGCRSNETKPVTRVRCGIKTCDGFQSGKTEFCFQCADFPCAIIKHLDKRYREKYNTSVIANLNHIREYGIGCFLQAEKAKWTCAECGGTICLHKGYCLSCNKNDEKKSARGKRGEISEESVAPYLKYLDRDLVNFLNDRSPQIRSSAATILGQRKSCMAIPFLCRQLTRENALYSKIAISNALGEIGVAVLPELMGYVGKIGHNQYRDLPQDFFKKWDYPLPRDIAIRTIIKVGQPALKILNESLHFDNEEIISEIIDAIGYISFYAPDLSSFDNLMAIYEKHRGNKVVVWKFIRALQAFPIDETIDFLGNLLQNSEIPQHRWEAARSLGMIGTTQAEKYLRTARVDQDAQVREMTELSIKHMQKRDKKRID